MKILVLGAGLVGGPMVMDLATEAGFDVSVADVNGDALERIKNKVQVRTIQKDLGNPGTIRDLAADADLVLNAVPGFMGFQSLKAILEAGKNVVDIAFFPEDPFDLDDLAKQNGVTAVVDCGVAPGMSNVLIGYADSLLDETRAAEVYVGGLPKVRVKPWEYKAVFSPIDVIEEYIRPAYLVEKGERVCKPALSEPELMEFARVGTLESFNTDGLRSLAKTMDIPDMKEKTLRYPGHIEKITMLKETGFFSQKPIDFNGMQISPLDFTTRMLFPKWKLDEGEQDITVMKIKVEGVKDGKQRRYTYDLFDEYDSTTAVHSMARTTGYTATTAVRMLAKGVFDRKGICPPEFVGREAACTRFLLEGLAKKGVVYNETIRDF
ncbi:MAG: saccharopine dehydrogenase [Desulfobacteraceae bacterium]|nr:saccharopine dehydrogenase [Desulfobacteraceae bacterium]